MLTYLLYVCPENRRYTEHCISKKNGGVRTIHAPIKRLKELQSRLSDVLYECQSELDQKYGRRQSYGFERGLGIIDNADCHKGKRWVFNTDIEEFFPSLNFGRVITFFKKNRDFTLHPRIATYIAQIACFENKLPQGAPSSPVIANLICGSLDYRLSTLASANKCNFSRYADDITFSTNLRDFPTEIAESASTAHGWKEGKSLTKIINRSGFRLNSQKTRMSHRRSQQIVTGLVVNKHTNFRRDYYKNVRAAIHHLIKGRVVEIPRFCSPYRFNCEDIEADHDVVESLQGQIAFCARLADRNDNRTQKQKFFDPSGVMKSYADLLFFRYFARPGKPLIITEGESDILYLKSALLSSAHSIDHLVNVSSGEKNELLVDFFKFPKQAEKTLGLAGGSGNLYIFLERYRDFLNRCNRKILNRSFVMVLDNDDGLKELTKRFSKLFNQTVTLADNSPFKKFSPQAAVVKTPHPSLGQKSAIEDFLDPTALGVRLNGKTFSPQPNYDTSKHFGKIRLASHIYENRSSYNFTALEPILKRISKALEELGP